MAKISSVFSLRHFLVVSLALNVSLILSVMYRSDHGKLRFNEKSSGVDGEARLSKRVGLSKSVSSSLATAAAAAAATEAADDGDKIINLDHGDPTMYEKFWKQMGEKTTIVIPGWQSLSYFSDIGNLCWFLEPEFAKEVIRLHNVVGNAVTENRYIVVGTGSTQLYLAALYALSPQDSSEPMNVVTAAPYYSSYPLMTDCLKSGLYKWAGDAHTFKKEEPYIELVTSPNNPDGSIRQSVVNRSRGLLVHDLAYYWPQYTPISSPADHDLMLFTVSKCTGHAGMRIGWALVKDREVAKKMTKFIELYSIGVSKDSQLRAAKVLKVVSDTCEHADSPGGQNFFEFGFHHMAERWNQLKEVVERSGVFRLPDFAPGSCNFLSRVFKTQPAFAWLKCEGEIEDCESFLRGLKILTRGGKHFGVSPKYVRISMLDRDRNFNLFVERLAGLASIIGCQEREMGMWSEQSM